MRRLLTGCDIDFVRAAEEWTRSSCRPVTHCGCRARPIRYQIPDHGIDDLAITAAVTLERNPDDKLGHTIDGHERGLQGTVRVQPHEITK